MLRVTNRLSSPPLDSCSELRLYRRLMPRQAERNPGGYI